MILSFKTQINGKPTYFVEKILNCISLKSLSEENLSQYFLHTGLGAHRSTPKIHTIRTDEKNRWKKGVLIDFFINARQKDMFRFAPRIEVFSIENIEIVHSDFHGDKGYDKGSWVLIDDIVISSCWVDTLARNDGFESTGDFFDYFNEDFKGKIIHWTDHQYMPEEINDYE